MRVPLALLPSLMVLLTCVRASTTSFDPVALGVVYGRAFNDTPTPYNRLPASANGVVPPAVWSLSEDSAGLFLQFASDAPSFTVDVTLRSSSLHMWHFPSTGDSGFDAYAWDDNTTAWRWVATTHPKYPTSSASWEAAPSGRYRVHLPTYNSAVNVSITVPAGHTVTKDPLFVTQPPVVHYGTSITQGGVASRPGHIFTHVYSRNLSRVVLNFGFSGNGQMQPSLPQYLARIPAAAFVIDCNWNMNATGIAARVQPFVQALRVKHPTTPIVLVEGTTWGVAWYSPDRVAQQAAKRAALRKGYDALVAAGDAHLYYIRGEDLYRESDNPTHIDFTINGVHPSDLGMARMAEQYAATVAPLLDASQPALDPHAYEVVGAVDGVAVVDPDAHTAVPDHVAVVATGMAAEAQSLFARQQPPAANASVTYKPLATVGTVMNKAFADTPNDFSRLPVAAQGVVRDAVWQLGLFSTGLAVRFVSNAPTLFLNSTLLNPPKPLWHMASSGTSGVDLYRWDNATGLWRHAACPETFPNGTAPLTVTLATDLPDGFSAYMLYLPLRNTAGNASFIGVPTGYYLGADNDPAPPVTPKPVVWYGTSIQQGGVAGRAGKEYDAILGRRLNVPVVNFGFAGNGQEEVSVMEFLVKLRMSAFILDCAWNLNAAELANRTRPAYQYLRANLPAGTPIVLAAGTPAPASWYDTGTRDTWVQKNGLIEAVYNEFHATDANLYFMPSDALYKSAGFIQVAPLVNPTVGGTHPAALGQQAVAEAYEPVLRRVLKL